MGPKAKVGKPCQRRASPAKAAISAARKEMLPWQQLANHSQIHSRAHPLKILTGKRKKGDSS
jgi:hypothetical protein